jgi:hypothetical protein
MPTKPMSTLTGRIKNFYKNNPWKGRFTLTFFILIFVLIVIRLSLPQTIIYGSTTWLKKQGIDSTIEAININIFDGTISLVNAKGSRNNEPLFNVGLIEIYWHWAPLSEKTVAVTKIGLDKFSVNIEKYDDEITVGGVHIPLAKEPASKPADKPAEQATPWAASLGEVIFTDLNICYLQHTVPVKQADKNSLFVDYCVDLVEMSWTGTISYATDENQLKTEDLPLSSTGNFALKGLKVTDNRLNKKLLVSESNTLNNVVMSGLNNLHIDKLDMKGLSLLQREDEAHSDSIRFDQLTVNDISLANLNALTINNISVSKPGVYLVKQNQSDWEYQQWIPQSSNKTKTPAETEQVKQTTDGSSFKLSLNDLNVNDSDLCYLDNDTSLYYCLTFEDFIWNGSVQYDTKPTATGKVDMSARGDIKLSQPKIHNQTIDRDLIKFVSLELTGLEATGTDQLSLNKFDLKKLKTLQRSKKDNDSTASFEALVIDNIKYTENNIAINSIDLKGLAGTVSKNKKGVWEHDKWIIENKADDKDNPEKEKAVTDKNKKPFVIALNKLNVTSDNKILFSDNTTEPATETGLQKLTFDISKLYTSKPDTNSPFKLRAKTIRHSTIDVAGTIKPFAKKVSMAADGKLKGFDLRAASPTTKKTIGHIIQSGQLDADLDLKAVNGELDSNIALSLYQFQMKSVSKEDAAKLDEKFGMPLNKTLVLLRDKDDSIHLDIPITGDVNNPDFNPMDAIIKATSKAATVSLITFYTPYGLLYAGGNIALNLATALNFDPIEFSPGSSEMQTASKEQLDKLSKLLTEKPQVRLTLCGITNKKDEYILYPERKPKKDSNDKKEKDIPLTKEQALKLNTLANERQVNSKNYLIKQHSIDHSRLILCEPEHKDDDEGISGVEINI